MLPNEWEGSCSRRASLRHLVGGSSLPRWFRPYLIFPEEDFDIACRNPPAGAPQFVGRKLTAFNVFEDGFSGFDPED